MIFLGCLFDRSQEELYLKLSKTSLSNAANTFQWNLVDGFNANLSDKTKIINVLPVGVFPKQYKKAVLENREWQYDGAPCFEIGSINLPFIKQYQRFLACRRMLKKSNDKNIVIYSAYLPFLKAISRLDKSYNVTVIITDLPEFYDLGKTSALKRFLRGRNNKKIYKYLKRVDNFVLLTEQMKQPLAVGDRPYCIVEGICSNKPLEKSEPAAFSEKIILYTGTLHARYGMKNLLDAFLSIDSPDYRLWICGGGDMKDEIISAAQKDNRITFYGYVSKSEAEELQKKATLLVNPRQNNDEFTKYSFPSKTMEYMLSGTPVLMYKLDGIPSEYDEFLYYVENDSVEALKNAMLSVCSLPDSQRKAFGESAAAFVAENKNATVQARRIIDLVTR